MKDPRGKYNGGTSSSTNLPSQQNNNNNRVDNNIESRDDNEDNDKVVSFKKWSCRSRSRNGKELCYIRGIQFFLLIFGEHDEFMIV